MSTKSPWPGAIIGFFVLFITTMVSFVVWSRTQREDLVRPDYYDHEIRYETRIQAIRNAQADGVRPAMRVDYGARQIVIAFPKPEAMAAATGTVTLYRPSDAAMDRTVPLKVDAQGVFQHSAAGMVSGLWRAKVEWSSGGKDYFAEDAVPLP